MLDFWENDEKGLKCFFSLQICQDFIKSFYKVGVKKIKSGEIRRKNGNFSILALLLLCGLQKLFTRGTYENAKNPSCRGHGSCGDTLR